LFPTDGTNFFVVIFPNFWAKIGLFLIRVLRKVVRCNGIVFSAILAKDLLLTGMYERAWVQSTVRVKMMDGIIIVNVSLKLIKVDLRNNGRHSG